MSLFRDAVDRRADEAISVKPAVQTGYMIETTAFVTELKKEPLFKTFNNMSEVDLRRVEKDIIENGLSVSVKDTSGVSRKETIHCNPKLTNQNIIGSESAKVPVMPANEGFAQMDLIFSGTNNQIPTVNGLQVVKRNISDKTQTTTADTAANTPAQGGQAAQAGQTATPGATVQGGAFAGQQVPADFGGEGPVPPAPVDPSQLPNPGFGAQNQGRSVGFGSQNQGGKGMDTAITYPKDGFTSKATKNVVNENSAVPKLIDAATGKQTNNKDTTQRGPYANNIRTGALKVGNYDLAGMVKMSTPAVDAILGGRPNR